MFKFDFSNLKGDFFGGISAGVVALPVALAFGAAAGLSPIHGLYGAIVLGFLAALVGGTQTLISNPTGPMAVVTGLIVGGQIERIGSLEKALPTILLIFFTAGLIQFILGFAKVGKYVSYIPHPVVSGFMSGIGGIIIILQLKQFFGVTEFVPAEIDFIVRGKEILDIEGPHAVLESLLGIPYFVQNASWKSIVLASATIAIIRFFPKITKKVPSALVALVAVTAFSYFVGWNGDVKVIGAENIPSKLPSIKLEIFSSFELVDLGMVITTAFSLAALGIIDSLLTSVVADKLTKTKHNSDRELLGQGIGNMFSALVGGIPGAGTTPATVLNINSGGFTKISGMIHALFLLLVLLIGGPVAGQIPYAVLAGVLITVGISILDFSAVKNFRIIPKRDNAVMLFVLFFTIFVDLLDAVGLGLVFSALFFMKKMADVVEGNSKDSRVDRLVDLLIDDFGDSERFRSQVYVKNLRGPVFFGFASRFQDSIEDIQKEVKDVKAVLFNLSGVTYMDQSGLYTFEEAITRLHDKGINVCISEANDEVLDLLRGIEVIPNMIDDKHVFSSVEECIMWLHEPGHIDNKFEGDDELYVPSAYTPNGDGINDEWQLRNIDRYPDCVVKIWTREEKLIFESIGYKIPWEGIYENKMLPADRYSYAIDLYGDGKEVLKGEVTIFR
ncbi:MAG: T9SS type B sorting domain-containing protein [Cytophagales bacterium]|nr:T9SS type B sorting domain-containing protein [Cytophagales bacterium]